MAKDYKMNPKVSIFIPTKNAGDNFYLTLKGIFCQNEKDFDVLIVDSGSTDNTLKIAKDFSVKIHKIRPEDFRHGKTRNLALRLTKGEFIVFLTQDAIPFGKYWLSNLLKNFNDGKVAGAFSRQMPKNGDLQEKFFCNYYYPNKKIVKPDYRTRLFPENVFFSNVSSCLRRSVFRKYKFNEDLIASEDQKWAKDVIESGYITIYDPHSVVIHSHDRKPLQSFRRSFDYAFSLNQIKFGKWKDFFNIGYNFYFDEMAFFIKNEPFKLPYITFRNLICAMGTLAGVYGEDLPIFLKKQLSLYSGYWGGKKRY